MRVLLAALIVAATTPGLFSQAGQAEPPELERVDLLAEWLEAVDRHRPGAVDESVQKVAALSARALRLLTEHFPTIVSLIRDPDLELFFRSRSGGRRSRQILYSLGELRQLRALAGAHGAVAAADKCRQEPPGQGRGINGANALLKRAAMLHLDVAAAIGAGAVAPAPPPDQRADRESSFMVKVDDGRAMGTFGAAGHLPMGRELLDHVAAPCSTRLEPRRDAWVRDWYAASVAHQLAVQQFEVLHVARAVELFRDDAAILALAGASHEALSTPLMQAGVGDDSLRRQLELRSSSGELGRAEDLLRQALQRDARHAEARLRLGNVLGLRGKHPEAIRELEQVLPESGENRLLAYYARMLHGRELDALGRHGEARALYEQAARLFPRAQAPRIALSQLLRVSGDAAAATTALAPVVDDDASVDPWWEYYASAGRSYEQAARALGAATPAVVQP
jgi:hypothetical protein